VIRLLLVAGVLAGCARPSPGEGGEPAAAPGDTLRGLLEVAGAEPATQVVLRAPGGGADTPLLGDTPLLRRLSGLEVMVSGARATDGFRVERVAVRSADGVPATDGVLARDGARDVLVTADGRRVPLGPLPEGLRGRVGARVWLVGPLDRTAQSYGIITP